MRFADALQHTMFRFKLTGVEIAERSGLPTTRISEFRKGKNIRIDNLEKILKALPKDARLYMLELVGQDDPIEGDDDSASSSSETITDSED